MKIDKDALIQAEIDKLNILFDNVPDELKQLTEGLIQNAAFMKVTLSELQEMINKNGAMIKYQSGNGFETIKDNPAQKAYTTMISRYLGVVGQLQKMLPDSEDKDGLLEYIE